MRPPNPFKDSWRSRSGDRCSTCDACPFMRYHQQSITLHKDNDDGLVVEVVDGPASVVVSGTALVCSVPGTTM